MQHIQLPDGTTAEFPDDISDEEIEAVLQREYPSEIEPTQRIPIGESPEAEMLAQAVEPEGPSFLEPLQAIGGKIAADTAELLGPVAKGEFDAPTALIQSAKGLGAGLLGFADEMLTRLSNTIQQLAQSGKVDPAEVYKVGKMRENLYRKFEPTDPLARATLAFIGAIPAGIESAADVLAEQFEDHNIKAAIQTLGYFGGLAGYGQVFKALKAPFKPKPKVKIPKTPKEFEVHMKEEAKIKLAREDKAALLRQARKEKLPSELIKELEKTEPLEVEAIELLKGELPKPIPETILRKGWQAIKAKKPGEVLYKKKGRVYKKEPKKVEIEREGEAVEIPIREEAPTIDISKRRGVIFPEEKPADILRAKLEEKPKKPPVKKVEEVAKPIPEVKEPTLARIEARQVEMDAKYAPVLGTRVKNIEGTWEFVGNNDLGIPYFSKVVKGKVQKKQFTLSEYGKDWLDKEVGKVKGKQVAEIKIGDKVEYNGEEWEVGFINQREWKGTLRLQKGPDAYAKQINHVDPASVKLIKATKPIPPEPKVEKKPTKLTILKDKKGLLGEIDAAIEAAPEYGRMTITEKQAAATVHFDIDGGANIINAKEPLQIFRQMIGKTAEGKPITVRPSILKPYPKLPKPTGKKPDITLKGEREVEAEYYGRRPAEQLKALKEDFKEAEAENRIDEMRELKKKIEDVKEVIVRTKKKPPAEVTLDTLGLQTSYEVGSKWVKAVKEGRTEKVRQATEQARKEFLTPVEGNPLDKGAIAFLKTEKFRDYIKAMPAIGELKPNEIFKYDPTAKKLIATIETKDGKLKPAIRQSGYHALKDFADSFEGVKDVSKLSATWTDPTRFIQELDQGKWGGMAQKHILWPMRSTTLAKLRWSDMRKSSLANIQEKYNAGSGKKADAIGDVVEYISTERLRIPSQQFLQIPQVVKALKGFKPKTKIELIDAAKEVRTFFNNLLKAQNVARKSRKQKLIDYRQLYRPWVMEQNIYHKLLGLKQKPETIMERPEMPDFIFPDKPPNPRALAREGGLAGYPKIRNIFRLAADYIDTAGRDIFDTNVVHQNKIHSAVLRGKGLENAAEGINRLTAEVYAGVAPRITRAAKETLPKPIHRGMLKIRRMLTRAVFPLNWTWNMFIQTSSAGITYARYGNRANLAGLRYFIDPKIKNTVQANAYSYILKSRWGGRAHYQDIQNSITRNKRLEAKPIEKVEDLFNYMTSAFENGLTGHAITAARYHGRTKLGLKGRELWEYASEGGAKTQSMYNYADLPGLLRAREVGAVTPFQTFSFEVFNTVREMNIPGLRKVVGKTGLYETMSANSVAGKALMSNRMKMLARWAVAIAITDAVGEKAIGRKPWVVSSFIPFVGYIVGGYAGRGPVPHQYIQDAKKGIRDVLVNEDFGRLRKWLLRYHVLAGVQLNRMLDGIEAVAKGGRVEDIRGRLLYKVPPEEYLKGILMGPYRTEPGKEYTRKRRKAKSLIEQLKKKQGTSVTID